MGNMTFHRLGTSCGHWGRGGNSGIVQCVPVVCLIDKIYLKVHREVFIHIVVRERKAFIHIVVLKQQVGEARRERRGRNEGEETARVERTWGVKGC